MLAVIEQHQTEGQIVVDGRDQPRATRGECWRAAPLPARGLVIDFERTSLEIRTVTGREAVEFAGGTLKPVSFIPSGSKMRSRKRVSNGCPVARAIKTPNTSDPVL